MRFILSFAFLFFTSLPLAMAADKNASDDILRSQIICPDGVYCDATLMSGLQWKPSAACVAPSLGAIDTSTADARTESIKRYNIFALAAQNYAKCLNAEAQAHLAYAQQRLGILIQGAVLAEITPLQAELQQANAALAAAAGNVPQN